MTVSPIAGKQPPASLLANVAELRRAYAELAPDTSDDEQKVVFGTSGTGKLSEL